VGGLWKLPDQRLFVPRAAAAPLVKQQHELTHLEKMALEKYYSIPKLPILCAQISASALHVQKTMQFKGLSQAVGYKQWASCLLRTWKQTSQRSSPVEDTGTSWSLSALTQGELRLTLRPPPPTQKRHKR
jgi:hypothetical protein